MILNFYVLLFTQYLMEISFWKLSFLRFIPTIVVSILPSIVVLAVRIASEASLLAVFSTILVIEVIVGLSVVVLIPVLVVVWKWLVWVLVVAVPVLIVVIVSVIEVPSLIGIPSIIGIPSTVEVSSIVIIVPIIETASIFIKTARLTIPLIETLCIVRIIVLNIVSHPWLVLLDVAWVIHLIWMLIILISLPYRSKYAITYLLLCPR